MGVEGGDGDVVGVYDGDLLRGVVPGTLGPGTATPHYKNIMAANHLFAYMGSAVTLLSIRHAAISSIAAEYQAVKLVEDHCSCAPIYQLPTQLFKTALSEGWMGNIEGEGFQIGILWINESHQEWLKTFSREGVKIQLMDQCQKGQAFKLQQSVGSLFSFKEKLSVLNLQIPADNTLRGTLDVLPERFLLVDLSERIQIFKVDKDSKVMIYRSNLDEAFHLAIIEYALAKYYPQALLSPINQVITKAILQGNIENSDLMVQDIFGKEGCSFIGLPPKLIAASLGKICTEREKSNGWDRLKSVLFAFGINLGKQINHQVLATKIKTTVLITHELTSPHFLQIVDSVASLCGELWIHPHGMLQRFMQRLESVQSPYQSQSLSQGNQ